MQFVNILISGERYFFSSFLLHLRVSPRFATLRSLRHGFGHRLSVFWYIRNAKSRRLVSVTSQYLMRQLGVRIDEILHQILRPALLHVIVIPRFINIWENHDCGINFLDGNEKTTELTETNISYWDLFAPYFSHCLLAKRIISSSYRKLRTTASSLRYGITCLLTDSLALSCSLAATFRPSTITSLSNLLSCFVHFLKWCRLANTALCNYQ